MGYIFEEIIRRFFEAHDEDAGQHYTPREVLELMVNILFYDDNDVLSGNNVTKTIYDPACRTWWGWEMDGGVRKNICIV